MSVLEGRGTGGKPRLLVVFSTVAGLGFIANILGYLRETSLAASYGSSATTDAFFAAIFIPNTISLIIASGAGAAILVPVLVEYRERSDREASELALTLLNLTTLCLVALALILTLTSSIWTRFLFPGFAPATKTLSTELAYILTPTVIFLSIAAILAGILNAFESFRMVALAPCAGNIITVAAICISARWGGIRGAAFGVALGALVQASIMAWITFTKVAPYRAILNIRHPGLVAFGRMAAPAMAYMAVAYLSVAAERVFVSGFSPGSMSTLNYAMRLFVLPASIVAGSLATVLHTEFSTLASRGDLQQLTVRFQHGADLIILGLVPVCIGAVVLSHAIVMVAYGYGKFSHQNVDTTAATFAAYSVGILPLGLATLCQRLFYAMRIPRMPLLIECVALAAYLIMAPRLGRELHLPGLALARSGSILLVGVLSMAMILPRLRFQHRYRWLASQLMRCALAAVPAAILWMALVGQSQRTDLAPPWARLLMLSVGGAVGLALYLLTARVLRCRGAGSLVRSSLGLFGSMSERIRRARGYAS